MHSPGRFLNRRDQLRRTFEADLVDGALVSSPTNVSYLTDFRGDASFLIVGKERDLLISDGRFTSQIEQECPGLEAHIRPVAQSMIEAVADVVAKSGMKSLTFETGSMLVSDFDELREATAGVDWVGRADRVEELRQIKDELEIEELREAIRIAERAFAMVRAGLRAEDTEKDAADALEGYLRRCGATSASFPPIVAVGQRSALPHAWPTSTSRIGDADFVLIDWGATAAQYRSDLTRVIVTGKVTPTFEKVYRTVLAAQERGIAAIRPGVRGSEVDAEARSVIEEAGFGGFFNHGLGHGIGMEIHEAPRIRNGSEAILQPGMVVTVEPGIYLPDWGGIRIEDDVLVTPDGCEILTHVAKTPDSVRLE
ncbi:MAG: aminopeptidase [Planctomycetes bacterium SCN 63-9]|nr:MAG: aminopeptidase [Planctomycetes bacterium SCN 63-9]